MEDRLTQDAGTLMLLFDMYGGLLTEHQRRVFRMRHHLDLSLSEIAGAEGISRQAVVDLLHRSRRVLVRAERKLGLLRRFQRRQAVVQQLKAVLEDAPCMDGACGPEHSAWMRRIRRLVQQLERTL